VHCTAHWSEGNINYLIGRVFTNGSQRSSYRCLAYTELMSGSLQHGSSSEYANNMSNRHLRHNQNEPDLIDLTNQYDSDHAADAVKSTLQILVSQDEFCRNIDNVIDEQFSFTFTKVLGSRSHVAPPAISASERSKRQLNNLNSNYSLTKSISSISHRKDFRTLNRFNLCKFPKWLNKKWKNLKQTKLFMLDYRLDSLLVLDNKNSIVINKYTCSKMKVKRSNYVQAVVKSLNGWYLLFFLKNIFISLANLMFIM
jgi:hypothetical protein